MLTILALNDKAKLVSQIKMTFLKRGQFAMPETIYMLLNVLYIANITI